MVSSPSANPKVAKPAQVTNICINRNLNMDDHSVAYCARVLF